MSAPFIELITALVLTVAFILKQDAIITLKYFFNMRKYWQIQKHLKISILLMKMRFLFLCIVLFSSIVSAASPYDFIVGLKQRNVDVLGNRVLTVSNVLSPDYGKYLTTKEVNGIVGYDSSEVSELLNALKVHNVSYEFQYDAVVCRGNIPETTLMDFPYVEFILPSTSFPPMKRRSLQRVSSGSVTREVVERIYNIPANTLATNVSGGAIEYSGAAGYSEKSLIRSQMANGLPKNPVRHLIGNDARSGWREPTRYSICITTLQAEETFGLRFETIGCIRGRLIFSIEKISLMSFR